MADIPTGIRILEGTTARTTPTHSPTVIALVGTTGATAANNQLPAGQTAVPAVGTLTRVRNKQESLMFGMLTNPAVPNYTPPTGTLPRALAAIYANGESDVIVYNVGTSMDQPTDVPSHDTKVTAGLDKQLEAESLFGSEDIPKIWVVPEQTWNIKGGGGSDNDDITQSANAILSHASTVAESVDGIVVATPSPGTVANFETWIDNNRHSNVYVVAPHFTQTFQTARFDVAPAVAGALARNDVERGIGKNVRGVRVHGLTAQDPAITFNLSGVGTQAATLYADNINPIVRREGWVLWGNKMAVPTTSTDPGRYINIYRTRKMLEDHIRIIAAHLVELESTPSFYTTVVAQMNAYLAHLVVQGQILSGECSVDARSLTNPVDAYFNIDYVPVFPIERVNFTVNALGTTAEA